MGVKRLEIGFRNKNKQGDFFEIIEMNGCNDITLKFDNGEILKNQQSSRVGSDICNILPPSKKNNTREQEKHGERYTKLWKEWNTMLWRCNPKNKRHHIWYSDKGIKVCDEWKKYTNFREWALSNGFKEDLTIDRIDEAIDYCPSNCRWLTLAENVARISHSKLWIPIVMYDLDGNIIQKFKNISSALRFLNCTNSEGIKRCCENKTESYRGYRWKYED